jgi:amino acid transporter
MCSAVSQEYGSGINFVLTQSLGPYPQIRSLAPVAMLVAGLFLLPKVVMFDRFARVMPRAGSTYVWMTRSVTMPVGFVVAFLWFIGIVAAMGFLAFSFPVFIQNLLTVIGEPSNWPTSTVGHLTTGLGLIWAIFFLHYSGVRAYGHFVVLLFLIVLFSAISAIYFGFSTSQPQFMARAAEATGHGLGLAGAGPTTPGAFFSVVTLFVFAYGGLTAATSLGGETRNAERVLGRGVWYAWATALILFTLVSFALFHAVPWQAVHPLTQSGHSSLATAPGLIGLFAPHAFAVIIDIAVLLIVGKTVAPEMLDSSRYLFAWAQDRLLPQAFLHTNRRRAPDVALLVSAVLGSLFLLEATIYGFQIGVTIRSMSIILVFGVLGVGVLNLLANPRYRNVGWARQVARRPVVVAAAILAIVIAVVLEASVLVVPGKSLWLQPSFQALVALILGISIYASAHIRAVRSGKAIKVFADEAPAE